ncbi:MAG: hypothetical protein C3F12_10305 [Candidatus Methylomirabilota bacterium]|nr:hypothetical protein [Candidatus Methylomirabilis sp.]NJD69858.1 hypothetical protein [candidate division NC10 bacterium]PWB45365.1 MAG: hypothetical protein C3F12_10305 [candidate division NC10 bacterium]
MSLLEKAPQATVTRRDLITRGLLALGALVIAKESVSVQAPAASAPRPRRAPMDRAKPARWRTRVRIIEP